MSTIHDFLLHHLNIHVTGPSFPHREAPLQCYMPLHRSFKHHSPPSTSPSTSTQPTSSEAQQHFQQLNQAFYSGRSTSNGIHSSYQRPLVPGASARSIPSAEAKDGVAVVYDKDVVSTWKLGKTMNAYEVFFWEKALEAAVGQEVLAVAVEGWMDGEEEDVEELGPIEILQRFGDYISGLGTQPVTLPIHEIVLEMLESYRTTITPNLEPFAWAADPSTIIPILSEFVRSQEIFFFPANKQPVLEIAFSVRKWHTDCIDLEFRVSWNPVLAHFEGLSNLVTEGRSFTIKPSFPEPNNLPPESSCLDADDIRGCLVGQAPEILAGICGAQKNETYTIALTFEGRLVKHFPAGVRFERAVRVAVPLTIQRGKSTCGWESEMLASPKLTGGPLAEWRRVVAEKGLGMGIGGKPLGRALTIGQGQSTKRPAASSTVRHTPTQNKENCNWSHEEVHKLLERKAEEPTNPVTSPTRLNNPLSLARFHEAVALQHPPSELRNVEVRTVHATSRRSSPHRSPFSSPHRSTFSSPRRSPLRPPLTRLFGDRSAEQERSARFSLRSSPVSRCGSRRRIHVPHFERATAESSKAAAERSEGSKTGRGDSTQDCCAGSSKVRTGAGPLDGTKDESVGPRITDNAPGRDNPFDLVDQFMGSKRSLRHGPLPFADLEEASQEDEKRTFASFRTKQFDLFAKQNQRAKRFGRDIDVEAIIAGDERVDDLDPKDLGPKDMRGKLREWEAEQAERMEQIKGAELVELTARVKEAEEWKSLFGEAGRFCMPGVADGELMEAYAKVRAERWQKTIQANHRELNEGKGGEKVGEGEEMEGERYREKLDTTMVDAVDSDEAELEGFSDPLDGGEEGTGEKGDLADEGEQEELEGGALFVQVPGPEDARG